MPLDGQRAAGHAMSPPAEHGHELIGGHCKNGKDLIMSPTAVSATDCTIIICPMIYFYNFNMFVSHMVGGVEKVIFHTSREGM